MTGRISKLLLGFILTTLCACEAQARISLKDIATDMGAALKYGAGRINGESFPIAVVTLKDHDLYTVLQKRFAGRFTVTVDQTAAGSVVTVADIYSESCPSCQKPDPDPLVNIRNAMIFHTMAGPSGGRLVMGMPGNAHLAALRPAGAFQSLFLGDAIASHVEANVQSLYRFESSEVQMATGLLRTSPAQFLAVIEQHLETAGFAPLAREAELAAVFAGVPFDKTWTWQRAAGVVSFRLQRGEFNPQTKVEFYEINSQ